jgi:hypothetical protein
MNFSCFRCFVKISTCLSIAVSIFGCASKPIVPYIPYDYTELRASAPRSILLLPPINNSLEIKASAGVIAQSSMPLAEAGYYVFPVAVVYETFRQIGLTEPKEIHDVSHAKLREIFGADAAIYTVISDYRTDFKLPASITTVAASVKLVNLKTGKILWDRAVSVTWDPSIVSAGGGLTELLIRAVVNRALASASDAAYPVAGTATGFLYRPDQPRAILPGPYAAPKRPTE